MAKLDLIDRTALVAELEGLQTILGDVFLGMVVARCIDRVKAQPVVETSVVWVYVDRSCDTCKHAHCLCTDDPCKSCISSSESNPNWEASDV